MRTPSPDYFRALNASPDIRSLDRAVRELAKLPLPCAGHAWELIVKPWATLVVGWERGSQLAAVDPSVPPKVEWSLSELVALSDRRSSAESTTEEWLRSQEAWEATTRVWLDLLADAEEALR